MRPTCLLHAGTAANAWAAQYLARLEVREAQTSPLPTSTGVPHADARPSQTPLPPLLTETDTAQVEEAFRNARRTLLKTLRVEPFSYGTVISDRSCAAALDAAVQLRGLTYDDYLQGKRSAADTHSSHHAKTADAPVVSPENAEERNAERPSPSLSSPPPHQASAASLCSDTPKTLRRWPSFKQLRQGVEQHITTHRYLWESTDTPPSAASSSPSHSSPSCRPALVTPSVAFAATPALLAYFPFSLFSLIAEHAVRHAWQGDTHVYPPQLQSHSPLPIQSLQCHLTGCQRLTEADVASQQWDRAAAARCLLSTLGHSCVQKQLRVRLWAAAQRYHRSISMDVDTLAVSASAEEGKEDVITLQGRVGVTEPVTVSVEKLKRELFSLPAEVHYTVKSDASVVSNQSGQLPPAAAMAAVVVVQSLRSSHWFHFTSTDAAVVRVLSERPHTHLFTESSKLSQMGKAGKQKQQQQQQKESSSSHHGNTTQENLWLLLCEMARLRLLVAYLLHLEVMLYGVRRTEESAVPEASKKLSHDEKGREGVADRQRRQEESDAREVGKVFRFLEMQPASQLQRRNHNRTFLTKFKIQLISEGESTEVNVRHTGTTDPNREKATASTRVEAQHCFPSVQALFTAFSHALEGHSIGKDASSSPSQHSLSDSNSSRGCTAINDSFANDRNGVHEKELTSGHHGDAEEEAEDISRADVDLLASIVAPRDTTIVEDRREQYEKRTEKKVQLKRKRWQGDAERSEAARGLRL